MKKAFTLIELLAVIILLAIISLIATPTVINVINAAKDKSDLESVHGILDSARLYYSESMLDNSKKINIDNLNNIYNNVSVSNKPVSGELYINEKGLTAIAVVIRDKCYTKEFSGNIQISDDTTNCTLQYIGTDTTAPTASFSVLGGTFNINGWAKNNFNVNITISDNESGPSSYKYCIDTTNCEPILLVNDMTGYSEINTESETNKVCVIGIDNYGNESSIICSDNYKLDKTNPTMAVNNISINKNTTIDLSSDVTTSDNLSGIDNYAYDPTNIDTSVAGDKTITYTVRDLAGNSTSIDRIVTVITDKPSIAYSTLTSPNGNGWFNSNFYIKAIATSDSTSSINNILWCSTTSTCTPSSSVTDNNVTAYITSNSATNKMCVQAIDTTGNSSDIICSSDYKKDSVTPTLTAISTAISITEGDSYSVSSYFNAPTYGISGGSLSCSPTNTSGLSVGSGTVSCTATSNSGLSTTASKTITINPKSKTATEVLDSSSNVASLDPDGNKRFVGTNPNNYVRFNNGTWRIIGVFNGKAKIIRTAPYSNDEWNSTADNNWTTSTINSDLNATYLSSIDSTNQGYIDLYHIWNLGSVNTSQDYRSTIYDREKSNAAFSGPSSWSGAIGIMYVSDYAYATSSTYGCDGLYLADWDSTSYTGCRNENWLYSVTNEWTMTTRSEYGMVYSIGSSGYASGLSANGNNNYVRPVLYLKSTVKFVSGDGTSSNPYILSY